MGSALIATLGLIAVTIGFIFLPAYMIWTRIRDKRRYRIEDRKNVREAIEKITEDGKVAGQRGHVKDEGR